MYVIFELAHYTSTIQTQCRFEMVYQTKSLESLVINKRGKLGHYMKNQGRQI